MSINDFSDRHIGPRKKDIEKMLEVIGVNSLEELINQTIPSSIRLDKELDLQNAISETRFLEYMNTLAKKYKNYR